MNVTRIGVGGLLPYPDSVELDLAALPPGLIAIAGPNGSGKTTLLEAVGAALHRTLFARPPGLDGLPSVVAGRAGSFRVAFEDGGAAWRAEVMVDGKNGASGATLFRDDAPVNPSGKVTDFDAEVRARFGGPEFFRAAVLSAQGGAGRLTSIPQAQRKGLFLAMIGASELEALAEAARKRASDAAAEVERAKARLEAARATSGAADLARLEGEADAARADAARARVVAAEARAAADAATATERDLADRAVTARTAQRDEARAALDLRAATLVRDDALAALEAARVLAARIPEVDAADRAREEALARVGVAREVLAAARATWTAAKSAAEAATPRDEAARRALAAAVIALEQHPAAAARVVDHASAAAPRDAARAAETAAVAEFEAATIAHEEARERARTGETLDRALAEARRVLVDAETLAAKSGDVPCGGEGKFAACRYILDSMAARTRLPALFAAVEAAEGDAAGYADAAERLSEATAAKTARLLARDAAYGERLSSERQATVLDDARAAAATLAHDEAAVEEAQARAAATTEESLARTADLDDAMTAGTAAATAARDAEAAVPPAIPAAAAIRTAAARDADLEAAFVAASTSFARARDMHGIAFAAAVDAPRVIETHAAAERDAAAALVSVHDADRAASESEVLAGRYAERVRVTRDAIAATATYEVALLDADREADEWAALARALGRNGVQAHEVDAAAPEVATIANDLLTACFGSRFALSIDTTRETADGKRQVETFAVRVYDAEHGSSADVEAKSGGEKVILHEALALALAIYAGRRSNVRWETLFRDETAGALDDDNAPRYVEMLRRAREVGGFAHIVFVAHQPQVIEAADVVVRVVNGQVTL